MIDNKYVQKQELIDYNGKKIPVVFCIDVSFSMNQCEGGVPTGETFSSDGQDWRVVDGGHTIMQDLIDRVEDFHNAMKEDRKTSITCQTAYVTFGDKATKIEDFGLVKNKKAPTDKLKANDNNTLIVDALELALKMVDDQKQLLKDNNIGYYQPWLIIFTDGKAHDDANKIKRIKQELIERQKNKKLTVYTMSLSDDPEMNQQIRGYSIFKPIPFDKDKQELKKFFVYLKNSVSSISNGKINEKIKSYTDLDDEKQINDIQ